ncbi:TonB-dependent receptor domain-containing protein [Massilia sp. CFBP9026]|uniref:TonB-dependent receptor domain-containing protein n=1 Tax=Massilia sp. CFBP9026 TaxID=3096536 RepID=UPI002A6B3C62|nr:TonB-dependent receptor [Massilia sp. CFBP9026]MDY0962728.1 TonB-dependent receptor [Massilia sp. CFBP9026]
MMETLLSRSVRAICLGGMTLGMTAAVAQETSQQQNLQRVEVTGSRIRQVDLETAQPIQIMNQEQIQRTGLVTVGDILNNLSSAGAPDFSRSGSLTSNSEIGGQYVSLRNLGSNRLLVLVDGKRWTQSVDGFTDLSTIPSAMIERMEILKDGASSIYGSDAIAGVVNIILKKNMQGGQLSLYTGQNEKNDGKNKDFSLSYGAGDEKASLMFGLSHTESGRVDTQARAITAFGRGPQHAFDGLGAGPWGRITAVNPANGGTLTTGPNGFNRVLNHTGTYDGVGVGADSRNPANYHNFSNNIQEDKYNSSQDMDLLIPSKLDTLFVKGEVALPKDMRFKTTAMYSQRKSNQQIAGYPLTSTSQANYPVYVDKDSYYNPYGNQVAGAGLGQDLFFARRTIELTRNTETENRTLHIDATLEGEFMIKDLAWNWSAGYNHSKVSGSQFGVGNINLLNLKRALGPSFMNASGVVQCGTPDAPIGLSSCTPFNILGGPSASTPEALSYINSTSQKSYGSTVNSATADLAGELFQLPAGAVGLAVGIEHREVKGQEVPGQFEQSGYSTELAGAPTYGRYTVREAYAELNVPVLKDMPFADLLSFNLAHRYSDYSNFGVANNSKFSFMYKPVNDLLVRGTWAEGFRAPTLGDTFGGGTQTFDNFLDPCDTVFGEASRDPAVQARCAASGTFAGYRQVNQAGAAIGGAAGTQSTVAFNAGAGNQFLQPETAKTRTVGFVYSPSFVPGLSFGLDWYNIQIENRITAISATYVANECFINNSANFCSVIRRDPVTGQIINLQRGNANLGNMETEGLDMSISYRLPRTAYGQFGVRNETSYVDKFRTRSGADSEWNNYAGEYFYNRVKSNTNFDWSLGNWSATWGFRYYSPVKDICYDDLECNMPDYEASFGTGANKLGSVTIHDVSVGYKTNWDARILFGINNVFDKSPRIVYSTQASASMVDADMSLDRFFYVRYTQNF